MVSRPIQHEVDTLARRQFLGALPACWVAREQGDDYGIDFEIEIFRDFETTGAIIKVQLKGTTEPNYIEEGDAVAFSLPVKTLRYLLLQVDIPTYLFIADIARGRTFWKPLLLDNELVQKVDANDGNEQQTITVHVPTLNALPGTESELVRSVTASKVLIANRALSRTSARVLAGVIPDQDIDASIASHQQRLDVIRLIRISKLAENGNLKGAIGDIWSVVRSSDTTIEGKLEALLLKDNVAQAASFAIGGPDRHETTATLCIAKQIRRTVGRQPAHLRWFGILYQTLAQLRELTRQDYGLYMNWKVNEQGDDALWQLVLTTRRTVVAGAVIAKYRHTMRLIQYGVLHGHAALLPILALNFARAMTHFCLRVSQEGSDQIAESLRNSVLQVIHLALQVAARKEEWDQVGLLALSTLLFGKIGDKASMDDKQRSATEYLELIPDSQRRQSFLRRLSDAAREFGTPRPSDPPDDVEWERKAYVEMARALGIDLANPADPIAEIINIGLKDLNPSRVLRNCRHLYMRFGAMGLPAVWLRMPSAGSKLLTCTKTQKSVGGFSLDSTYDVFCRFVCNGCTARETRDPNWQWNRKWQAAEDERWASLPMPDS